MVKTYRGPKTEAIMWREGFHIHVKWIRYGKEYYRTVYDASGAMKLSDWMADLLVMALEGGNKP